MRKGKFTILATVALGFAVATSTAMAQTTTFHDRAGRVAGKTRTAASGTTSFHDEPTFDSSSVRDGRPWNCLIGTREKAADFLTPLSRTGRNYYQRGRGAFS